MDTMPPGGGQKIIAIHKDLEEAVIYRPADPPGLRDRMFRGFYTHWMPIPPMGAEENKNADE